MESSSYTSIPASKRAQEEERVMRKWRDRNIFHQTLSKDSPQGNFVFYEGPPGANSAPMIHHLEARAFKDIIPRYKTMRGFHVDRRAGWDCHGLPVELQAEKELGLKSKKEIETYGIAQYNAYCRDLAFRYTSVWNDFTERIGYWVDNDRAYYTMQNSFMESAWNIVSRAHEAGHLYKGYKILPWCTRCGTGLSSHELGQPGVYEDVKDLSIYAKFKLIPGQLIGDWEVTDNTYIVAWTTTPWTLPGNVALAVSNDIEYAVFEKTDEPGNIYITSFDYYKRTAGGTTSVEVQYNERLVKSEWIMGSSLVGIRYEPLYPFLSQIANEEESIKLENAFKVYAADFVTTTEGTGVVHIAPMYGTDDFDLATEKNLPKVHIIDDSGCYLPQCGDLSELYVKEKNEKGGEVVGIKILEDLDSRQLRFKKESYSHSYLHCWRCKTPILYFARSSWYFKMSQLAEKMVEMNAGINWEPDHIKDGRFGEWLRNIKDWAISRDRYWGTPLPVWETTDGMQKVVIDSVQALRQYTKKSGNTYIGIRHGESENNISNIWNMDAEVEYGLTEIGREQVRNSAEVLRDKGITKIVTSPFARTRETAGIIADILGIEVQIDARLSEYGAGALFEGSTIDHESRYDSMSDPYRDNLYEGESLQDLFMRTGELLYELESVFQGETILIVSHMSPLVAMRYHSTAPLESPYSYYRREDTAGIKNAQIVELPFVSMPHNAEYEVDLHKPYIDQISLTLPDGAELVRTPEVMDVWFDSGCMPLAQDHFPFENSDLLDRGGYPADYISEAIDQTRGWFYTLVAVAALLDMEAPFKSVICLGHVLDDTGQKMSKSKGNTVDPWEQIHKYGADVVRLWMFTVSQPGDSKSYDEKSLADLQNKFFTMLENCISFYELYKESEIGDYQAQALESSSILDQWIINLLHKTGSEVTGYLDEYKVFESSRLLREFVLDLSQWYIRRSRDRVRTDSRDKRDALATMKYVFSEFAKLIAPFTPFFAESIYERMEGIKDSIHLEEWTDYSKNEIDNGLISNMQGVRMLISSLLELRARSGIKVRQPLASVTLTKKYEDILNEQMIELIQDELNVKEVLFADREDVALDTDITPELFSEGDAREVIRTVQELRKQASMVPSDMVTILMNRLPDPVLRHREMIMSITGASDIVIDGSATNAITLHDGSDVHIGIV